MLLRSGWALIVSYSDGDHLDHPGGSSVPPELNSNVGVGHCIIIPRPKILFFILKISKMIKIRK